MEVAFKDSMRMEILDNVLDGDAEKAVSSISTNSIFYSAALKTLQVKCTTTCFTSTDCQSVIYSTKKLIKAVRLILEILCKSLDKVTQHFKFLSGVVALKEFQGGREIV